MELVDNLLLGFSVAFSPANLFFCLIGTLIGTAVGVLPGIGPVATLAMLLPMTFSLSPIASLIMLAGIYYGAQYGGSTTAILVNLPGEASSIVTCLDGHAMARQGRAGSALAVAALGSFVAGTVGTLIVALASPALTAVAIKFGAAEYFALMVLGLVGAIVLAQGELAKAGAMVLLGLFLSGVGTDPNSGEQRFTLGIHLLSDGIGFVPVALGLFGLTEIILNLEGKLSRRDAIKVGRLLPTAAEAKAATPAVLRGTLIGSILGVLPGGGALLASFVSYSVEKNLAKDPARFGNGAIEGVAAPESANNAGAQVSFIPMLTLGIPANAVMALMIGALTIQGVTPGPQVMVQQKELVWGIIASMWIGNVMLLIINLPLIGLWVRLLSVPYRLLFPSIMVFIAIGILSVNNLPFEILLTALFGCVGWLLVKFGFELAPLVLGFVLGPMLEDNLRRALRLSHGDPLVFLQRPISLGLLLAALALLLVVLLPSVRKTREQAFQEA
jgi:putative tricarboxylic transport membrane protein